MNHSIWRKTLSLLLALVMVMGMVCTTAFAEGEEGAETEPVVCTQAEDCAAETHEAGCPKYVAPEEPEVCETCGQDPCVCEEQPEVCETCGQDPCVCEEQPKVCETCGQDPCVCEEPEDGDTTAALDEFNAAVAAMVDATDTESTLAALEAIEAAYGNLTEDEKAAVAEQWDYIQGYAEQVRAGNPDEGVDTLEETEQTESVTGYNGADLPEEPTVNGDTITVTSANAQYTLDGAYGSIDGKTIEFTGEYTDILYVNRPSKYSGSGTVYYNGYGSRTQVDSASELHSTGVTSYTRDLNNVTLTAADDVVIPGIQVYGCGHHHDSENTGIPMDPVREIHLQSTNTSYYFNYKLDGLTFDGLTIRNQVGFLMWDDSAQEDGAGKNITFKNCKFLGDENQMKSLQAIKVVATTKNYYNLTVEDCTFTNYYQGVYTSNVSTGTFKDNSFTNLTHNAIALQNGTGMTVGGKIEISGNTFTDGKDRCIRFGNIGEDAEIVVSNNTATNYSDSAGEIMKAGTIAPTASITIAADNDWGEGKKVNEAMLPVAEVNGKQYSTLQAAINAAQDGDTVVLLKTWSKTGYTKIDKSIILDLNNKLVNSNNKNGTIIVDKDAVVTITNGEIRRVDNSSNPLTNGALYIQKGTAVLTNVTVNAQAGDGVMVGPGVNGYYGKLILNSGTKITSQTSSGVVVLGMQADNNHNGDTKSEVTVNEGAEVTGSAYGIAGNGLRDDTVITINGGTVKGSVAIYHPQQGTLTINGGTIEGKVGVQTCAGTVIINDGATIKSTETNSFSDPVKPAGQSDGSVQDGSALSVLSRQAYGDVSVTVNGGTFETGNTENKAVVMYGAEKKDNEWVFTFEKEGFKTKASTTISGGTFSSDVTQYCAPGLVATAGDDGKYTVGLDTTKTFVAQVVGGGAYEKLADAIKDCPAGGTVKVLADVTLTGSIDLGKAITIEGVTKEDGSKPVISGDEGLFSVTEDSATLKNLELQATGNTWYIYHSAGEQTGEVKLTVNGCDFTMAKGVTNVGNLIMTEGTKTKTPVVFTNNKVVAHSRVALSGPGDNTVITGNEIDLVNERYDTSRTSVIGLTATANTSDIIITGNTFKNANRVLGVDNSPNMPADKLTFNQNKIIDCRYALEVSPEKNASQKFNIDYNYYKFNDEAPRAPRVENADASGSHTDGFATELTELGTLVTNNVHYTTEALSKSLSVANASVQVGNTVQLTATSSTLSGPVTWSSGDTGVATVSATGVVTGVTAGTVTITALMGDTSATCTVTVSQRSTTPTNPGGGTGSTGGSSSGGSGSYRPSGGGSSSGGGTVNIQDPDVPLAELPLPFEDVKDGDWYREAVAYVYSNGLMVGTSDTLFGVNTNTSRGMMATVIYRLDKEPNTTFEKIFSDVDNGMWYSNPITWANANKVAVGYDDGSFGPNDNVTREQLIAMLYRYAGNKGYDVSKRADLSVFADAGKVSGYAEEAMSWAVAVGLIQGRGASKLAPTDLALRVEVAAIFQRFASLYEAETLA